jgi:hypothetical protein
MLHIAVAMVELDEDLLMDAMMNAMSAAPINPALELLIETKFGSQ